MRWYPQMNYLVISADLDKNKEGILLVWEKNFPHLPSQRYDWIYQKNPDGRAFSWIALETKSRSLVGSASLFPRRININGRTILAGIAGDFAVNQEHRNLNAAIKLQRAVVACLGQNSLEFIYGISNRKSEPAQLRAGYVLLGKIERWAKLLKIRKYFKPPFPHWLISRPLDSILRALSRETRYRKGESYTVHRLEFFDQRFDHLWDKASKQFKIIGQRSKEYLNWRYGKSPHRNYHIFSLIHKDTQEIWGYIVYYLQDQVCFIADMLFLDFGSTFETLLSEFILYLRGQDVESISILLFGCPTLAEKLRSFGFHPREEDSSVMIYLDKNYPCSDFILNRNNWLLLEGDRDI